MNGRPTTFRIWWEAARPRTLPAAIAPVLVGTALAARDGAWIPAAAAACLGFALLIQIGTNFANDYFDFKKGADTAERVGPRRAVASGWVTPRAMLVAMALVFHAAFVVGLTLLGFGGWPLLWVGVASIVMGLAYTGGPYPLGYNGLGDLFVFIFFGLVAVTITYYVQTGTLTTAAWIAATGVGALTTNILVVNNYRDVETDRKAGKRTLVVRFGRRAARAQFLVGHGVAVLAVVALGQRGDLWLPVSLGLAAVAAASGLRQARVLRTAGGAPELIALLGDTGRHVALYAVGLAAGLLVSPAV